MSSDSEKLKELREQIEIAEASVRTAHAMMSAMADRGCMETSMNWARQGIKNGEVFKDIKSQLDKINNKMEDVTQTFIRTTEPIKLKYEDIKEIVEPEQKKIDTMSAKRKLLNQLFNEGKIDRNLYNKKIKILEASEKGIKLI